MQWQKYIVCLEFYSNVYFYLLTFLNKSVENIIFYIISEHMFPVNFKFKASSSSDSDFIWKKSTVI